MKQNLNNTGTDLKFEIFENLLEISPEEYSEAKKTLSPDELKKRYYIKDEIFDPVYFVREKRFPYKTDWDVFFLQKGIERESKRTKIANLGKALAYLTLNLFRSIFRI